MADGGFEFQYGRRGLQASLTGLGVRPAVEAVAATGRHGQQRGSSNRAQLPEKRGPGYGFRFQFAMGAAVLGGGRARRMRRRRGLGNDPFLDRGLHCSTVAAAKA